MFTSKRARLVGIGCAAVAASGIAAGGYAIAAGSGTPANKVTAAASKRVVFGPGTNQTLMTARFKTSKPTDLMIQTALECSIFTRLVTDNSNNSSMAGSNVRVWIELDGKVVPLQQISAPPQNGTTPPQGDDSDKVTFCDREYQRTVTDEETNVPLDGTDREEDYIRTKTAHAFNWVRMNAGSGMHTIAVKADLSESVNGDATAEAEVGNRTLIVEPTKMANDAVIAENGSS